MNAETPLVSCVMPTADRRPFVPSAVAQFLAQDYPNRELIVVDDGSDRIDDLIPNGAEIRYHRLGAPLVLGAKRNMSCELARGDLIAHWDDDDWMAPWRLSTQVAAVVDAGAEVCGLRTLLFHDVLSGRAWRYTHPETATPPWVAGQTMMYRRAFWERNRFEPVRRGEDTRFLWTGLPRRLLALDDDSWYVARVHPGNTSLKRPIGSCWSAVSLDEVGARQQAASARGPRHSSESAPPASWRSNV